MKRVEFGFVARGMFELLRGEQARIALVIACIVIDVSYGAFAAITFSKLVDQGILLHNGQRFAFLLAMLGIAMLVAVLGGLFRDWLLSKMGAQVARTLRQEMYARLVGAPYEKVAGVPRGDVLYRFSTDVLALEHTVAGILPALVRAFLAVIVNALVLARERWWFALISIGLSLLALIAPRILALRSLEATRLRREAEQQLLGKVNEALDAADLIRVLGLRSRLVAKFVERCGEIFQRNIRATFMGFAMTRGSAIGMNIAEILAMGVFGAMAVRGFVTPGRFVALHALFMELAIAFLALTQLIPGFLEAHVSLERLQLLRDLPATEPDTGQPAPAFANEIALDHVTVIYPDGKRGLIDVSLVIKKGEFVALVGSSGSGKSTVARSVLGLVHPASGQVLLDGISFSRLSIESVRDQMGAVFQETLLFDVPLEENIALGSPSSSPVQIQRAIGEAGLAELTNRPSFDASRDVGEGGQLLSGGQRQRIGFARALVRNPAILVLDEPTSQLDRAMAAEIGETIRKLAGARTVILITHDLSLARRADRIVVMSEGHVAAEGTHEALLATSEHYRSLVKSGADTIG